MKIYLYDTEKDCIGTGSLTSQNILKQLEAAGGGDIDVHISSAGGSAFEAIAMYDMLKKYPGKVTTYVDALAASAASVIAMAGDNIIMSKYALMMIHKPAAGSGGNADELLKDVQMLNTVQSRLAQIYMDRSGLDAATVNSLIDSTTWLNAAQALELGFIDRVDDYMPQVTNSLALKKCADSAPAFYRISINNLLNITNKPNNMNMENKDLIDKTASVLDKMMNFFKRVVNRHTVTDKGTLHHAGKPDEGAEIYQDEDMTVPAEPGTYTTPSGSQLVVKDGRVKEVTDSNDGDNDDDQDDMPEAKLKKGDVQNRLLFVKAKLHAQNALLNEARVALEKANARLQQTRDEVRNEIKSDFTPEGSRRSNKAKTETQPFFSPQTTLAQNAVRKAVRSGQ